jgi:hypothetical protein
MGGGIADFETADNANAVQQPPGKPVLVGQISSELIEVI